MHSILKTKFHLVEMTLTGSVISTGTLCNGEISFIFKIIFLIECILMFKKLSYFSPALLWMGIIFTLSSFQAVKSSDVYVADFVFKKTVHVVEYSILWFLLYRPMKEIRLFKNDWQTGLMTWLLVILYAASDEFHQTLVPSREGTVRDVLIDTFGSGAFMLFYLKLKLYDWVVKVWR